MAPRGFTFGERSATPRARWYVEPLNDLTREILKERIARSRRKGFAECANTKELFALTAELRGQVGTHFVSWGEDLSGVMTRYVEWPGVGGVKPIRTRKKQEEPTLPPTAS